MFSAPAPSATFAVGKFAGDAEYVRMDGGPAAAGLDDWLSHATAAGYAKRGDSWRLSFPMGSPIALLWRAPVEGNSRELLCGVMAPSRDAVGRDYPLMIVTRFSERLLAEAPHVAPLAFGNFLDVSYETIAEARSKPMPMPHFFARVSALTPPTSIEVASAAGAYDAWCKETSAIHAWGAIFGPDDPVSAASHAVAAVKAAIGPAVATGAPFVARLPLGTLGPSAACVWLDVVRRAFRRVPMPPTAFWGVDDASLLVAFDTMPPGVLADLWAPSPMAEETFDVLRVVRDALPPRSQVSQVMSIPASGAPTMRAWLDSLGR
jgi:type VI secretion system ImpM family protein